MYIVQIWQFHKIIDSFKTNDVKEADNFIKSKGYALLYDYGGCMIYVYKNEINLSLTEMENEGFTWCKW